MTTEPSPYLLISELKESDFWNFFHLRITDEKKSDDSTRYFLKPGGHQTEVDLSMRLNQRNQITESILYIKRDWLFGEPYGINPFALDIVRSFITANVSPYDTSSARELEGLFDMQVVYQYYQMFKANFNNKETTHLKIMKVYFQLENIFLLDFTHSKIQFENQMAGSIGRLIIKINIQ